MRSRDIRKASSLLLSFVFTLLAGTIQAQIVVNSSFEGGNGVATYTNAATNEVDIVSELKGGDTKNIVYYVEITGLNPAMPLTLEVNATWSGHHIVYSYDNVEWHKATLTNLNNFNIPLTSSTVYVAHSYPYTYSDMINDVNAVAGSEGVAVLDLAISEEGRPVKLVRITDDCVNDAEKELIWVFGRMHAFENPGNMAAAGMLDYFVSDQPSAARLRKEAIIYVVPMMDVDMAYHGGSGKDQLPVDFNRDWLYLNTPSHWNAVVAAKAWMDSTAQLNNFSVFFDSHSPPPSQGVSLFYYIYDVDHQRSNVNFVTETVRELGNYQGNDLLYAGLDISISQDYVLANYDNPWHYNVTMETGFGYRPDGEVWTKELYLLHGAYHGVAISDFIHGHANNGDLVIDNNDSVQVVLNGTWTVGTDLFGYLSDDYLYADATSPVSITFNATIPTAGPYEVFTRWVADPGFATNALASFIHAGGTAVFSIDMTSRGGNWVPLDTFVLGAGEEVSFTLSNASADGTLIADGLRIAPVTECLSTSVQANESPLLTFELYPNPATDQFTIQSPGPLGASSVRIYDPLGKLVLLSTGPIIRISSLSAGPYLVDVRTEQGRGLKQLIVR